MADKFTLILGDRQLSSWSLRAWLMAKHIGIDFETKFINLSAPSAKDEILRYSPSGKVPALMHNDLVIWDSLAIAEYFNELFPTSGLFPRDVNSRAIARSVISEMHSGFQSIRSSMPFSLNCGLSFIDSDELRLEIKRVEEIWLGLRTKSVDSGGYLFGEFGIADAMFAPVVLRFKAYGYQSKNEIVTEYCNTILNNQFVKEWCTNS
ncbi:MAG: glutathione S-transferase family protein [Burkholderiales bacterium]|nr:glutathione S-transferase family protein [Burkholderiales bacterium]